MSHFNVRHFNVNNGIPTGALDLIHMEVQAESPERLRGLLYAAIDELNGGRLAAGDSLRVDAGKASYLTLTMPRVKPSASRVARVTQLIRALCP